MEDPDKRAEKDRRPESHDMKVRGGEVRRQLPDDGDKGLDCPPGHSAEVLQPHFSHLESLRQLCREGMVNRKESSKLGEGDRWPVWELRRQQEGQMDEWMSPQKPS